MLSAFIDSVQRRWLLLVLLPVLAAAVAYGLTTRASSGYEATATVLISPPAPATPTERADDAFSARLTRTYSELVRRPVILDEVRARLLLPPTTTNAIVAGKLSVQSVDGTLLLRITAKDVDGAAAAALANTTAIVFSENSFVELAATGTVTVVVPATTPLAPVGVDARTDVVLAAGAGFVLALAGVLVLGLAGRPRRALTDAWPPVAPPMSFIGANAAGARSPVAGSAPMTGFFAQTFPTEITQPASQEAEVAPQATAFAHPGPAPETTTLPTLSDSSRGVSDLRERFLRDEDLRPDNLRMPDPGPWPSSVSAIERPAAVPCPEDVLPSEGAAVTSTAVLGAASGTTGAPPTQLSATMTELMGRLDETVDMIRALRPSSKHADSAQV